MAPICNRKQNIAQVLSDEENLLLICGYMILVLHQVELYQLVFICVTLWARYGIGALFDSDGIVATGVHIYWLYI